MGSCTRRHFLLSTCFLQMITIIERQIFDFLGYMWAPIFVNFFHIIFVIFGFYGAYHFRVKYIITYLIWSFLWIGWNSFLICFYLDVGELDKNSDLLNLGTGSVSWFEVNGYGCKPTYSTNITSEDPYRPIRPERVDDCLLEYPLVETIQSGVQCALAAFGVLGALMISYLFLDEDDRFDFMNGDAKSPQHTVVHPMYVSYTSIPTSASATILSNKHNHNNNNNNFNNNNNPNTIIYNSSRITPSNTITFNKNPNNNNNSDSNKHHHLHLFVTSPTAIAATSTPTAATIINNNNNQYYDDSTATADQLYTNSNRRQMQMLLGHNNHLQHTTPPLPPPLSMSSLSSGTTSSLSYASLHKITSGGCDSVGANSCDRSDHVCYQHPIQSNSNSSSIITTTTTNNNSGRLAKSNQSKPSKSSSYSSFINASSNGHPPNHRPDIKYTQISTEPYAQQNFSPTTSSMNFDESFEDIISLQTFTAPDAHTYVPFQKPTPMPSCLFLGDNNGNSNSYSNNATMVNDNNNRSYNNHHQQHQVQPNHPIVRDNSQFLLNGNNAVGGGFELPLSPAPMSPSSDLARTPPPPPPPSSRHPHIFQPRSGQHPYPDLSPEVTEKYSMPYQYVPRSPVASRIAQRRRHQHERSHLANAANFCDQIRDAPPGYIDTGFNVVRAKSHDKLSTTSSGQRNPPAVSANSGKIHHRRPADSGGNGVRKNKPRPRSYCNGNSGVVGGGGGGSDGSTNIPAKN